MKVRSRRGTDGREEVGDGAGGGGEREDEQGCREDKIISGTSECGRFRWKRRPDRNPGRERTIIDAD